MSQKDGETVRLEKSLSEAKASLTDKSFQYQKTHNNFSSEVQAMSDRIAFLESDKLDMAAKA